MAINRHITHIKSSGTENGQPKLPTASQIELGEIAVNYADGYETLSIKNNAATPEIVTFSSDDKFYKKTETSGSSEISSALSGKSDTGHTHSQYLTAITSGDVTSALGYTPLETAVTSVTTSSTNGNISVNGSDVAIKGLGEAAYLSTGTTTGTVAAGDHTHTGYIGTDRTISTASGLTGGGNLSADRTIGLEATGNAGTYYRVVVDAYGRVTSGNTTDDNSSTKIYAGTTATTTGNTATSNPYLKVFDDTTYSNRIRFSGKTNVTITSTTGGVVAISANTGTTSETVAAGNHTHAEYVGTGRTISTANGLTGGGNLSADRTIGLAMPTTHSANTYTSVSITSSEPCVYCRVITGGSLNNQICPVSLVDGQQCNVIYQNSGSSDITITIAGGSSYYMTDGSNKTLTLTAPKSNGYAEVNYIKIKGRMFVRGV